MIDRYTHTYIHAYIQKAIPIVKCCEREVNLIMLGWDWEVTAVNRQDGDPELK